MSWLKTVRTALGEKGNGASAAAAKPPAAGLYHFRREQEDEMTRLHLRIDPSGDGLLVVNASRVFHLNPTAAAMAYLHLYEVPEKRAVSTLARWYRVTAAQARDDYTQISALLSEIARPDGACPVCELDVETTAPFSARPSAPYRMDLALTYRCNNDCSHCYNARPRAYPEMDIDHWKAVLDRTWQLGIPHVVFTGGEPTLRDDLAELVAHAEGIGLITGLNTNARRLADPAYLEALVKAGLDHVQITIESHDPAVHDAVVACRGAWQQTAAGLRNALGSKLYVMTNTTLLAGNSPMLAETLEFLADEGVPTVGLNALIYSGRALSIDSGIPESALPPLLETARAITHRRGQRLIWYTPTQYCQFDPMMLELGIKGCTAALYNMCVEPDGKVIPCQSYYQPLGDLLADPWESIWNHPLSVVLRERRDIPEDCRACQLLPECGGGCPLARQANAFIAMKPVTDYIPTP
jgi:radical SAM protein with 4Fe4S-binding SPASM domain